MRSTVTQLPVPFGPGSALTKLVTRVGSALSPQAYGMLFYSPENAEGFLLEGIT